LEDDWWDHPFFGVPVRVYVEVLVVRILFFFLRIISIFKKYTAEDVFSKALNSWCNVVVGEAGCWDEFQA
jgi:hypothetical protein